MARSMGTGNADIQVTLIGLVAGALTTISFLPQAIRIWRTRSAKDISYAAVICFTVGISLWLWYGLLLHNVPIVLWNAVTLALNISILGLKIAHHEPKE
jgi:MtN3 and saliva related transmembrane protein